MKAIIAVNNLGYIGKDNKLLWRNKQDLQHFKKLTLNQTCLVGWRTYQELPPLKDRTIVVDKRNEFIIDGIDWVIGGKNTYEKYAPYIKELHISIIDNNQIGDTMEPKWNLLPNDCKIFHYEF